jgi:hypothetical protein
MPSSGFLPYEFNFSERWVVLNILETSLNDGYLNISVRIENLDNGMVIDFNFRLYGNSPYPINEAYLERGVRCPVEEFSTYNTSVAITIGGVSAIALVVGVAAWRRRRFDEVIGVPEPFVGGGDLSAIVSPIEVDSSN